MSMMHKIQAALTARGETLVDTGKNNKWTRKFNGMRNSDGTLNERIIGGNKFWFVGVSGSLRIGSNRASSRPVNPAVKASLIEEGAAVLKAAKKKS